MSRWKGVPVGGWIGTDVNTGLSFENLSRLDSIVPRFQDVTIAGTLSLGANAKIMNPGKVSIDNLFSGIINNVRVVTSESFPTIQSAIDDLTDIGGIVFIPAGTYNITEPLTVGSSVKHNVMLIGAGAGRLVDVGSKNPTTQIVWTGSAGGTMVNIQATSDASNQAVKRGGLIDIFLDGNNSADFGLNIDSLHGGKFSNLTFFNCRTYAIDCNVVTTLGEATDVSACEFSNISIRTTETTNGGGIRLDGDGSGNASFNMFSNIDLNHKGTGIGLEILNGDNNSFHRLRVARVSGSAIGVKLDGSSTVNNYFFHLEPGLGGLTQQNGSDSNIIFGYDRANGSPAPTISSGSLTYTTDGLNNDGWHLANALEIDGDLNHDGSNVGFYGTAPVSQASASAALTGTPGTADGAMATISGSGDDSNINNNFQEVQDKVNAALAALRSVGLIAT